jgi:HK97 family phage prohead protease
MSTMHRAYALLEIKSADTHGDERRIVGVASTPTPDGIGDTMAPDGCKFTLPLPLLWQHKADAPIGHVVRANATAQGIEVEAQLARIEEPGRLKDRLDEAWHSIKSGLVRGLSIGFRGVKSKANGHGGQHYSLWRWLELSCVTMPMNAEASIVAVKSADAVSLKRARPLPVVRLDKAPNPLAQPQTKAVRVGDIEVFLTPAPKVEPPRAAQPAQPVIIKQGLDQEQLDALAGGYALALREVLKPLREAVSEHGQLLRGKAAIDSEVMQRLARLEGK